MLSVLEKALQKFQQGEAKGCLLFLKKSLDDLNFNESNRWKFRNEIALLLARCNRMHSESATTPNDFYFVQANQLDSAVLGLINDMEAEIAQTLPSNYSTSGKHRVEIELNLDFEKTTDEEIQMLLAKLAVIFRTSPDELLIMNKRPGSIILEFELTAVMIVKIKSLAKLNLLKELNDIRFIEKSWDWMNNNEAFIPYLSNIDITKETNLAATANFVRSFREGVNLLGADLRAGNLTGVDFICADLRGADLRGANLSGVTLIWADLSGADLSGADLCKANLTTAFIINAHLCGANLFGANLSGAVLLNSNLVGADLNEANLQHVTLTGSDLRGLDFIGTDLREINLIEVNLSGANLSMADLTRASLNRASLVGAILNRANFSGATLIGADLSKTYLGRANFRGANLRGAIFREAYIRSADFTDAIFHVNQTELLKEMGVDISTVKFIDDLDITVESSNVSTI